MSGKSEMTSKIGKGNASPYGWQVLASALVVVILLAMELRHPYFFLQDDNRDQFLPYFVHNLRSLLAGEIPLFNFHQHLGTPVSIQYAALYPLNYVALLCSKLFLGDYFGTMEFLALIHLLVAANGFYQLMRSLNLDGASSCLGALAWVFCGFVITIGDSWIYVLAYAAYLPWITMFSVRMVHAVDTRSFLTLAALKVMVLLSGNPQFFAYTATFDFLMVTLLFVTLRCTAGNKTATAVQAEACLQSPFRFYSCYVLNYALVFVLALPMLLPALQQVRYSFDRQTVLSLDTYTAFSYDLSHWLHGLVVPFLDVAHKRMGEQHFISHIGYLPLLFAVVALLHIRKPGRRAYITLFTTLGVFALLWASDSGVTRLFYHVPIYNRFRWPFKVAFFSSFYLVIVASLGCSIVLEKLSRVRRPGFLNGWSLALIIVTLQVANALIIHAYLPQHMLSRHEDRVPFDEPLKRTLVDGRIVSVGPDVRHDGDQTLWGHSVPSIGFNYATLWGLYHFGGYDGLLPEKNFRVTLGMNWRSDFNVAPGTVLDFKEEVPLDYLRKWGVRWYVIDRNVPVVNTRELQLVASDEFRNVWRDDARKPYAFWSDQADSVGVPCQFGVNSIALATERPTDGLLTVNVLHHPYFKASIDGGGTAITETEAGQMAVAVPKGRHTVTLTYRDPYFVTGCVVSVIALFASVVTAGFAGRSRKVRKQGSLQA